MGKVPPLAALPPGAKAGPWIVEQELGRGGMGAVYAVTHDTIGKRAALKVLHDKWTERRDSDRILLEARVVNQVSHPGIVDIFETGTLPDGRAYIVMERLDGEALFQRAQASKLLPTFVLDVLLQTCDALAAAHAVGVVHRDLKPDNIFLCETGDGEHPRVKLLDWGIAKLVETEVHRTLDGQVVGTPQYLSPEQARGAQVTVQSDVYSLGVMTYELFLEQPPFEADSAVELLAMHLHAVPYPPRDLWPDMPERLEALLLAMLQKAPERRPSLTDVIATLVEVRAELTGRIPTLQPMLVIPRAPSAPIVIRTGRRDQRLGSANTEHLRPIRRSRTPLAVAAAALLGLGLMFTAVKHTRRSDAETLGPSAPAATQAAVAPALAPVAIAERKVETSKPIAAPAPVAVARPPIVKRAITRPRPIKRVDPNGTISAY